VLEEYVFAQGLSGVAFFDFYPNELVPAVSSLSITNREASRVIL